VCIKYNADIKTVLGKHGALKCKEKCFKHLNDVYDEVFLNQKVANYLNM